LLCELLMLTDTAPSRSLNLVIDAPAADRDWRHPWLRINLPLLNMTKVFGIREVRSPLKVELNKAIAIREKMRRATWWN
jgi:hypothetical protein